MDLLKIRAICVVIDLTMIDVCSKRSLTSSNGLNLISPLFPNEYPNNLNCTCSIETKKKSNIIIDVEVIFAEKQKYVFWTI